MRNVHPTRKHLNLESLCANCTHLQQCPVLGWHYCKHRNQLNRYYTTVYIDTGYRTCTNFTPKPQP